MKYAFQGSRQTSFQKQRFHGKLAIDNEQNQIAIRLQERHYDRNYPVF